MGGDEGEGGLNRDKIGFVHPHPRIKYGAGLILPHRKGEDITPIERKRTSPLLSPCRSIRVLCINLVASYLISFPLMMGEGKDGGGRLGPYPPHLNPPPPWGEEFIFGSIGALLKAKAIKPRFALLHSFRLLF